MSKEELLRLASLVGTDSQYATANFINAIDMHSETEGLATAMHYLDKVKYWAEQDQLDVEGIMDLIEEIMRDIANAQNKMRANIKVNKEKIKC